MVLFIYYITPENITKLNLEINLNTLAVKFEGKFVKNILPWYPQNIPVDLIQYVMK